MLKPRTPFQAAERRRGAAAVFIALVLVLLIGFTGLALDTALVRLTTQELQDAADSAALAAVQEVYTDSSASDFDRTRNAAIAAASANRANTDSVAIEANISNAPAGDIVVGTWDRSTRLFTPTTASPNAVQVTARRTADSPGGSLDLVFGGNFGNGESGLSRTAIAHLASNEVPSVILALDPSVRRAFDVRGTAYIEAPNGRVQVNSSNGNQALWMNGAPNDPRVIAEQVTTTGGSSYPAGSITPNPESGYPPEPDPLAHLPYPDPFSMTNYGGITGAGNYSPGYYPDGVDFNSGVANLNPGVYYFGSHGIDVHSNATLRGDEVMLFLAEDATIQVSGNNPGFDLTAPSSGTYEGVAFFAHRDTTADFALAGTGQIAIEGAMYLAGAHLELDGNGGREIGRIIANTIQVRGTGTYTITGEGPPDDFTLYPYLVR